MPGDIPPAPPVGSRPQRFSSSMEFVLSGPSGVILCCPVQGFVLSGPSGAVLYHPVWFAARLQTISCIIYRIFVLGLDLGTNETVTLTG